jgi:hypothetical protein
MNLPNLNPVGIRPLPEPIHSIPWQNSALIYPPQFAQRFINPRPYDIKPPSIRAGVHKVSKGDRVVPLNKVTNNIL